ncbi:bifunctional diaminohydroxyphosphoribosylaminopyrimidine deaminase/5-amino-6-(5-phosphoribosylamino)uracil reductase RibD [Corynebacterium pacaense]|uniref:bifunctional diaminohydroxyphosphoribosylaminopyrimidine deaminase/5-amino-6-(5-phosphoribosylamino)uracil reductase RibD n=1 Tax=Corynebacterium pacaense TaxID=1816684 RepID=UPI0009BA6454|nr:bifunctional diaminohydroxyphosphoribosylaminopyrimidine deaminase/5-amino-6-(5-phosphoribosylamino)uracil reductase RibD [Corynebacterium pacaense]
MEPTEALDVAALAAEQVRGTTSPNPPVGAVILDAAGQLVGTGATRPPGGAHAEIVALAEAGGRARGGTAVVTLEPCNHTGRTGPCTRALLEAGIVRVVYAVPDPFPQAAGGGRWLSDRGVDTLCLGIEVPALRPWLRATRLGRPHVTWKFAATMDGYSAAGDGGSRWITGPRARAAVHLDRSRRDAIMIGSGTALQDDPALTARAEDGLYAHQPRRVVIGGRTIPADSQLGRLGFEQYAGIDQALAALWDSGARDVLVEGGPTLAAAFLDAGLVDAVQAYLAPALLGTGRPVLDGDTAGTGVTTMADIRRFDTRDVQRLGPDVLIEMVRPTNEQQDEGM